jgi:hypothetical protein
MKSTQISGMFLLFLSIILFVAYIVLEDIELLMLACTDMVLAAIILGVGRLIDDE